MGVKGAFFGAALGGGVIASIWPFGDNLDSKKFIDLGDDNGKHVLLVPGDKELRKVDADRVAELTQGSKTFDQMRADFVTRLAGKEGQEILTAYNKVKANAAKHEKGFQATDFGKSLTVDELSKMELQLRDKIMPALHRQERYGAQYSPAAELERRLLGYERERDILAGEGAKELVSGSNLSHDAKDKIRDQIPTSATWDALKGPPPVTPAPKDEIPAIRFMPSGPGGK